MSKHIRSLLLAACITLPLMQGPVGAAQQEGATIEINTYLCKDLMRMQGEERSVALAAYHGYVLGKKGTTSISVEALNNQSNQFIEHCLDNPHDLALVAFEKLAQ